MNSTLMPMGRYFFNSWQYSNICFFELFELELFHWKYNLNWLTVLKLTNKDQRLFVSYLNIKKIYLNPFNKYLPICFKMVQNLKYLEISSITYLFRVTSVPVSFLHRLKALSKRSGSSFRNLKLQSSKLSTGTLC